MRTMIDQARQLAGWWEASIQKWPLLERVLVLALALVVWSAAVLLVELTTDNRILLVLTAVFLLPVVLRTWMEFYWQLRDELRDRVVRRRRS